MTKTISISAVYANSLPKRVSGLIGKSIIEPTIFQTRFGIHTFGVKFPIDVLVLNKQSQVAVLKQHLKPNRVLLWNLRYDLVIELPVGTISKKGIKIGSTINILKK